jgi:hypothetical protein
MHRVWKGLLYAAITFFTLYLVSHIVQYGLMMLMCVILIAVGSLLWIHVEGASSRETLWSMTRRQRQLFHAKNLRFFTVVPLPVPASNEQINPPSKPSADKRDGEWAEEQAPGGSSFRAWNEWRWRKLADSTGEQLSQDTAAGKEFVREVDNYVVRNSWPTAEEVAKCDNTIVLSVRGLWAGLAARINPVLNAFLNRFVKCWNRSLMYCGIRLSAYGLPYPCVTLDFPTADVATLNFGQKDDCLVMSYVYDLVRKKYPEAKIILLSVCLGGLRILNWLRRNPNPENVIGVVLESPLPSVRHLLRGFLGHYYNDDFYHTFCLIVPNFRPEIDDQYCFCRKPNHNQHCSTAQDRTTSQRETESKGKSGGADGTICKLPVFVGMIETDPFSNPSHLPLFCDAFPNLTVFTTNEREHGRHSISHGKLYRLPAYRAAAQTFIAAIQFQHASKQAINSTKHSQEKNAMDQQLNNISQQINLKA